METSKSYLTVKQIASKYPCFSESAYRAIIFRADENGFAKCIKRVGKKILIDEDEFNFWIGG